MKKIILIATFILVPLILVGALVLLQKNENIPENIENQQENEEVVVEEVIVEEVVVEEVVVEEVVMAEEEEQESPEGDFEITEEDLNMETWQTYSNEEYGFSLKYPKGWIVEENDTGFHYGSSLNFLTDIIFKSQERIDYHFIPGIIFGIITEDLEELVDKIEIRGFYEELGETESPVEIVGDFKVGGILGKKGYIGSAIGISTRFFYIPTGDYNFFIDNLDLGPIIKEGKDINELYDMIISTFEVKR